MALHPDIYRLASAAADAVRAEYAGKIEAAQKDRSLTADQRAAAVIALRQRQKDETRAIRRRILEEEKGLVRLARKRALPWTVISPYEMDTADKFAAYAPPAALVAAQSQARAIHAPAFTI